MGCKNGIHLSTRNGELNEEGDFCRYANVCGLMFTLGLRAIGPSEQTWLCFLQEERLEEPRSYGPSSSIK